MRFVEYKKPNTLDEAYTLLIEKKKSVIVGGGAYIRLHNSETRVGIDLSNLGLEYIKVNEVDQTLRIGAMTTLRTLEIDERTKGTFSGIVGRIAGVPIRNIATLGGSVCGKYPFSDVMPILMVLGTKLRFHKSGEVLLSDYMLGDTREDILEEIIIPKANEAAVSKCFKLTYNDFSVANVAVLKGADLRIAIGARPGKAKLGCYKIDPDLRKSNLDQFVTGVIAGFEFDSDFRAGKAYREHLAFELLKEALMEVMSWK